MVTWSPGDVDVGIQSLLIQFYPILLSTLFSINRDQLSTTDASFALSLSSSPLTMYLVFASTCDLFGIDTGLYKRIKSHHSIIRILGALVLVIWTGLSMILKMSTTAFKGSSCDPGTFVDWLLDTLLYLALTIMYPGDGSVFSALLSAGFITFWIGYAVGRRSQLRAEVKLHSEGASWFRISCTWVKCSWYVPVDVGPRLANLTPSRCVIDRNHKWYIYCLFAYLDISWAQRIVSLAILASQGEYVLSYGQVRVPLCAVYHRMFIEYPPF